MLQIKNLKKTFGAGTPDENLLFQNFQLEIPDGQFVSIIGSNGSGKSSLLNMLCGTLPIDGGQILYQDKDISHDKEFVRSKHIGRVFQDPAMGTATNLTVLENLSIAEHKGQSYGFAKAVKKDAAEKFRMLLKPLNMGLENRLEQKCGTLSGGQRQALALLMSTMTKPDILVLDEHTAALDPKSSKTVMDLTQKLLDKESMTVLMVTHNLRFALEYGDRILMMHEGKVILDKAGEEKNHLQLEEILDIFNEISIEAGNTI